MSWPLSQDYNEAIQDPRQSFGDAELKTGEAVTNPLGIPMPRSGNFADVYEVRCPSGSRWAVKCFTREVFGLRERYAEIGKYLHLAKLPFMVDFNYLEQGIRVRGQWYPILKMQWVEGFVLNEFVRDNLDKKPILQALGQVWLRMAKRLREANIAHGDLQHGNVLFVPDPTTNAVAVKLIDYDGMWVPSLAGKKSGEVGHPCYQHPQRLREQGYGPAVDRFPLLLIATALHCLHVGGRPLWDRHDSGDNLLFREGDLRTPVKSRLFYELLKLGEPRSRRLVEEVLEALRNDLAGTPPLDAIPELQVPASISTVPTAKTSAPSPPVLPVVPAVPPSRIKRPPIVRRLPTPRRRGRFAAALMAGIALLVLGAGSLVWFFGVHSSQEQTPSSRHDLASLAVPPPPTTRDKKSASPKRAVPKENKDDASRRGSEKIGSSTLPNTKQKATGSPVPKPSEPVPSMPMKTPRLSDVIQNSIGMKLTYILAGKFRMGSSVAEIEQYKKLPNQGYDLGGRDNEQPQHEVRITRGFYLGVHEVTQGEYMKIMGTNPSKFKESPTHPVDTVVWRDAMLFCKKLSDRPEEKTAERRYRLPTEAEWEYACRAGTTTAFHYGNSLTFDKANFNGLVPFGDNSVQKKLALGKGLKTVKVGSYQPNAWGLYDMHGNVWEWCLDGPRRYTPEAVEDPQGPEEDIQRVLRGGSWRDGAARSGIPQDPRCF